MMSPREFEEEDASKYRLFFYSFFNGKFENKSTGHNVRDLSTKDVGDTLTAAFINSS